MNIKIAFLHFAILSSFFAPTICEQTSSDHAITIFVHETIPARRLLAKTPGRSLVYCPQGLSLAKDLPENYHFHKIAQGCVKHDAQRYNLDQFYNFGWESEHICDATRKKSAQQLMDGLQILATNYHTKHHVIPKIRLIGYSHGGNVVVNTGCCAPLQINNQTISIEAWIFGTPVQEINHDCINSDNFNKIYSFYSEKDHIQTMDPQGLHSKIEHHKKASKFWSERTFDQSSKCLQINFKVNGKARSHLYYRTIFKDFPLIAKQVEEQSKNMKSGTIAINFKK